MPAFGIKLQRRDDTIDEFVVVERFLDEIEGAFLECGYGHRHIAVAGQENDRQATPGLEQAVEQLDTAHARHAYVEEQATGQIAMPLCEEFLTGREADVGDAARLQQPTEVSPGSARHRRR